MELNAIYAPVHQDLDKVDEKLKTLCQTDFPEVSKLLDYSLKSEGKRIRPALTLLAGKFYDYNLDYLLPMAAAAEMMHIATLVHDDAIDNASTRRGRVTVNKLWGEDKAVLLGDYLFAEAGGLVASTGNLLVIKLFASTLKTISAGELNQGFSAFHLEQERRQYIRRVAMKTASLFTMATESGAALSKAPEKSIQILIEYGYNLGIAFQIVDDILDFIGTEQELGKPVGSDLTQGTLTLPMMLFIEHYPEDNPIKKVFNGEDRQGNVKRAIEKIRGDSSIIQECYQLASEYCAAACRNLNQLPDNAARQSLTGLADYIIRRRK
ncbi:MAG: polyprenyl synthetase family protein [Chloroflexota bacterium]